MRIYVEPPEGLSRAMARVAKALRTYAPELVDVTTHNDDKKKYAGIEFVSSELEADLVVLHVIGYPETAEAVKRIKARGQKYAIIQYCVRTTQKPNALDWMEIWRGAEVVWSYYDLGALWLNDIGSTALQIQRQSFDVNFYYAPLGVDNETFRPYPTLPKKYLIGTSGYVAESECVNEAYEAVLALNGRMFHLGPDNVLLPIAAKTTVNFRLGIADWSLAEMYARCKYVAGLRRGEGFELPAAEGLLCGARPIVFDQPHYRQWYGDFAEYIPEGDEQTVRMALTEILAKEPRPITDEERERAVATFNWQIIVEGFWDKVVVRARTDFGPGTPVILHGEKKIPVKKRKLLWVGDAGVSTGFAKCSHKILEKLQEEWDIYVIGLNYKGGPHDYPHLVNRMWPANVGGDNFGVKALAKISTKIRPDLIVVQNDPWNFKPYIEAAGNIPVVGVVAVDGFNCRGRELNGLKHAIFWTKFGELQANFGGYSGTSSVIPLGVDLNVYKPMSKTEAREIAGLPEEINHGFIIGNVNRNQPRKRIDLTVMYFAKWVKEYNIKDAYLYFHAAPTGDPGWDIEQLMQYFGLNTRLILADPGVGHGISERGLCVTYNVFDIQLSTSQGEGWGLTTMEGMACRRPSIYGNHAALGEWITSGAGFSVPCTSWAATPSRINAIGGIPNEEFTVNALNALYTDREALQEMGDKALECVSQPQYRWEYIGQRYAEVLHEIVSCNELVVA